MLEFNTFQTNHLVLFLSYLVFSGIFPFMAQEWLRVVLLNGIELYTEHY